MLTDQYDNPLHTQSPAARDAYVEGLTAYLEALAGVDDAFDRAIAADPEFALAYAAKARNAQVYARMGEAKALMAEAMAKGAGLTGQALAHLEIFDHLINSRVREGYTAVRAHLLEFPRDALVAQSCLGVFSLIGFSGQPGREAEHLALAEMLAPAYGQDGWFLGQLAFAQMEAGQLGPAESSIETALALRPRSAHGSHIRAHLYYEAGQTGDGLAYLSDWMTGYDRSGMMHCHNSWHCALWSVLSGDDARMWQIVDRDLQPERSQSPALNILTDLASLYYRAGLTGVEIAPERWVQLSDYAAGAFPRPGLGFADIHAALAHAMAGQDEPLMRIVEGAKGPAADQVAPCARAFRAIAVQDWAGAEAELIPVMADHARLGGSRAQRDLLEYTLLHALIRQGKADEARRLLSLRRPLTDSSGAVQGLAA
ncbi:tetratricopeptide repeat protein [Marimonas arenosa]|uniref:Tetratricopeptide repeat protein 38 n=1 Tax=Marimonas arenosa TaxID=1795305 RepID=A0AAE4B524_9RHOB|nr:tetratricopeptide repeat protein [Marimonas arenosa]MDQ2088776.1 tetratricopeptide repeat protein [Marimonas arenosa]